MRKGYREGGLKELWRQIEGMKGLWRGRERRGYGMEGLKGYGG